jgi:cysteine desulfurase
MRLPVYLDNNSTTPLDPLVLEAMLPYFTEHFGNPSNSTHAYGERAARAVESARKQVAEMIGARPKEVFFTSGATESNNLAILGIARGRRTRGDHVVTTAVEHKAVLGPCHALERDGFTATIIGVDEAGKVDLNAIAEAITKKTVLVSVMAANNEIGTLQPIEALGAVCGERGVPFHSDAAQAIGKLAVDVDSLGLDALSISAHKVYGPKGVGALYLRDSGRGLFIEPLVYGGGQERGFRSGTLPVANIVGLGVACELARNRLDREAKHLSLLRERLLKLILGGIPEAIVHGDPNSHLPGLLSVSFPGVDGDALIHSLREIAVSQGSSCATGSFEPSHVLRAIGLDDELAKATIRFGVGRFTTEQEVDYAAEYMVSSIRKLRDLMSPADSGGRASRLSP